MEEGGDLAKAAQRIRGRLGLLPPDPASGFSPHSVPPFLVWSR